MRENVRKGFSQDQSKLKNEINYLQVTVLRDRERGVPSLNFLCLHNIENALSFITVESVMIDNRET